MKKTLRVAVAVLAVSSLLGCAQTTKGFETAFASSNDPTLTPEEQALVNESSDIVQRSIIEGALIGAAAGCVLGMLVSDNKLAGCAIGGAGGAVVGAGAGAAVGQGNVDAKRTIDDEEGKIQELRAERQRLVTFEAKLEKKIAEQNAELSQLNQQLAANQIDEATYRQKYRRIKSFREKVASSLDDELETRREDKVQLAKASNEGVDVSRVEPEVDENIAQLQRLSSASRTIAPPAVPLEQEA